MTSTKYVIAVLGGAGAEGSGLAVRWANAGHTVILGSRNAERAEEAAASLGADLPAGRLTGADNATAAGKADIVALTVPYAAQQATALSVLDGLRDKILIDVTVPLMPPKVGLVQLPPEGSAAVALQQRLGADVKVVSAFQSISAHHLKDLSHGMDCDVLVSADDADAAAVVVGLAADAGLRGWHAGPLANAAVAEGLTSVLITLNRKHKVPSSGIQITGI
jgi:NADPH-dependent F420 reductase